MPLASRQRIVRAGGRHASNLIYTSVLGVNASKKTRLAKLGRISGGWLSRGKVPSIHWRVDNLSRLFPL